MRVAIVCSCAEAGRNGVGDYSVRLASALVAAGHAALVVAERDTAQSGNAPSMELRENIRIIRLPGSASNEQRAGWLDAELLAFEPDWVLLQFVSWGMANRGVLDPVPRALLGVLARWRLAVYFHELWLGLECGASLRHRWWGRAQRRSILRFLQLAKPALTLTSNAAYGAVLDRFGWKSGIMPLHGNIPVCSDARADALGLLKRSRGWVPWNSRREVLMLTVFGAVFPAWNPEPALQWLCAEARRRSQRVLLVSVGRPSEQGTVVLERLARRVDGTFSFVALGEASPRIISGLLQETDVGMPTTDWLLLDKSSAAAAMREHGLPILIVRNRQRFRDLPGFSVTHGPAVFCFDPAAPPDFDKLVNARQPVEDALPALSRQLIALLERAPLRTQAPEEPAISA